MSHTIHPPADVAAAYLRGHFDGQASAVALATITNTNTVIAIDFSWFWAQVTIFTLLVWARRRFDQGFDVVVTIPTEWMKVDTD